MSGAIEGRSGAYGSLGLGVAVTATALPSNSWSDLFAAVASTVGITNGPTSAEIDVGKCLILIGATAVLAAREMFARWAIERACDRSTSMVEETRDDGLVSLPQLAREQTARHVWMFVLAAMTFIIAPTAWAVSAAIALTAILCALSAAILILWSRLLPVELAILNAFRVFKKHVQESLQVRYGRDVVTVENSAVTPVSEDAPIDVSRPKPGVGQIVLRFILVAAAAGGLLAAAFAQADRDCHETGQGCKLVGDVRGTVQMR